MDTHRTRPNRFLVRRPYCGWLLLGSFAALIMLAESASASLILDSVRYDGHVKESGVTGVEKHFRDFTPAGLSTPSGIQALPAVDPDPPAPLDPANDLQIFSYLQTTGGLGTTPYVEIWINKALPGSLFANALDTMLGMPPIELELELYLETLAAGDKLVFPHIGAEVFGSFPPHPAPATASVSNNRGSSDDPIHVLVGLNPSQANLNNVVGQAKVRFYYDTMRIPEPASLAMASLGSVGVLGLARRRRRK